MYLDWEPEDSRYENDDWQDYDEDFDTYGEELDDLQNDQWIVAKRHDDDFWEDFEEEYDSYDTSTEGEYFKHRMIEHEFGSYENYINELNEREKSLSPEDDDFWGTDGESEYTQEEIDDMPF